MKVKQIALFYAAATLPVSAMADDAMADQAFAGLMRGARLGSADFRPVARQRHWHAL